MPSAKIGSIDIEYDVQGEGEPLLLVMGLGAQLIHWQQPLVDLFAADGYQVIRFDNRDTGLSTKFEQYRPPRRRDLLLQSVSSRFSIEAPYRIRDMAADAAGLLDHLGIENAHVIGVSMGGMIAQRLTIDFPDHVRSLISVMSTPGGRRHRPKLKAMRVMLQRKPRSRQEAIDNAVRFFRTVGGTAFERDDELVADVAGRAYDRAFFPRGVARQLAAIMASKNRFRELGGVTAPTTVIHGDVDPLVPLSAGTSTAEAIPNARVRVVAGMGHELPPGLWPILLDEQRLIAETWRPAELQHG